MQAAFLKGLLTFDDPTPVFVTRQIIITDMEI